MPFIYISALSTACLPATGETVAGEAFEIPPLLTFQRIGIDSQSARQLLFGIQGEFQCVFDESNAAPEALGQSIAGGKGEGEQRTAGDLVHVIEWKCWKLDLRLVGIDQAKPTCPFRHRRK